LSNDIPITPGSGRLVATDQINNGGQLEDYQLIKLVDGTAGSLNKLLIDAANAAKVNIGEYGGTAVTLGQKVMASSIPVTMASDNSPIEVELLDAAEVALTSQANGSQRALDVGVNVAGVQVDPRSIRALVNTDVVKVQLQDNAGTAITLGQKVSASSLPIVLASDQSNIPNNVTQFGGTNISTGTGASGAGIPRVTISNDSSLAANQSVNLNQVGAAGVTLGSKTSANSFPVVIASDQGNVAVSQATAANLNVRDDASGATAAAVPARAFFNGGIATTANPANATAGNLVGFMADKAGRLVVTPVHTRDLTGSQTISLTNTSETTMITAGAAGVFNDLATLVVSNGTATATVITIKDATAGTTRAVIDLPASIGVNNCIISFIPPIPQTTAANNWTATASITSNPVHITATFVKNT
jgi:hypothetical protein